VARPLERLYSLARGFARNPLYAGKVRHRGTLHDGQHLPRWKRVESDCAQPRALGGPSNVDRRSTLRLLPALTLLTLTFLPARCLASESKWTLDVGASRTPPLTQGFNATEFVSMGVLRSISQHLGLQVRTAYRFPYGSTVRSDFLPVGLGIRFFGDSRQSACFSRPCLLSSFPGGQTRAAR